MAALAGWCVPHGVSAGEIRLYPDTGVVKEYSPQESCAKAKETLHALTAALIRNYENATQCLEETKSSPIPTPSYCVKEPYFDPKLLFQYEMLAKVDCGPKRDPRYPTRTDAYSQ